MTINGKVALVTGAAQGIGRGIALRIAKDGADIAIVDITTDKMAEVAAEIEELGRKATTFKADVRNRVEIYDAVEHAEKRVAGSTSWSTTLVSRRSIRSQMSHQRT
jgi:meso-butanediol dehydrogenase/(S,S)-butanediol dehydrogenase/diacetyl reductase